MKRRFVSIFPVFLLLLAFPAMGASISGIGYGSTADAAEEDAVRNLMNRISMDISSLTYTSVIDDGESSTAAFSDISIQSGSFKLRGASIETSESPDGGFSAFVEIPESSIGLYRKDMEDLAAAIERIDGSLSDIEEADRIDAYLMLISLLRDYDAAENVVMLLDPESEPVAELPITKAEAEFEYRLVLSRSISQSEMNVENLNALAELGMLSHDDGSIAKAMAEHEALLERRRQLQEEMDEEYSLRLEQRQQEIGAAFHTDVASPESVLGDGDAILDPLLRVEAARNAFLELKSSMDSSAEELEKQYVEEANSIIDEVLAIEFFPTQLDGSGRPKDSVITSIESMTQKQLDDLLQLYGKTATDLYLSTYEKMLGVSEYAHEEAAAVLGTGFTISNRDYTVTTSILPEYFDAESFMWRGTAYIAVGDDTISLPFEIPYEAWTGESIDYSSVSEMMALYSDAEFWTDIFAEYPGAFTITMEGTFVGIALDGDDYQLSFDSYSITRNDTGRVVCTGRIDRGATFHSTSSVDLDDFTIDHDFLLRNYEEAL